MRGSISHVEDVSSIPADSDEADSQLCPTTIFYHTDTIPDCEAAVISNEYASRSTGNDNMSHSRRSRSSQPKEGSAELGTNAFCADTSITQPAGPASICDTPGKFSKRKSYEKQTSFFGPTSQMHVASLLEFAIESGFESDESAAPGIAIDMNSTQLRSHLLQTYFKYQNLWALNVVHMETFMRHRAIGTPSRWYSSFLESVLLACAARLSTSGTVRALAPHYAKQAKVDILRELETPTAASLQGLLMLSEYEVTQAHDKIGWMLCGMFSDAVEKPLAVIILT